jgi:transposase-like protein
LPKIKTMARYTKEYKLGILNQKNVDESVYEFSNRIGIKRGTIYQWLKDIERAESKGEFVKVKIEKDAKSKISIYHKGSEIQIEKEYSISELKLLLGW